ncbi:PREDICTED: putative E3 ubiquitin-protein ligase UNKL [Wasmannia auropunctata]|uniref:putative E3 ubiquitin-protein ligase UNKL n=1 Tax=Wasmannia auropunctata TaxID=64793 RepID=UPI0005EE65D3|nr:PREDICTED: putative E3 ubiquitin-protein ligase UNKL [Wasmannia auropunctata]
MSTAVMSNTSMFECGEHLFKNAASTKAKEPPSSPTTTSATNGSTTNGNNVGNGHAPLKRSYTSLMTTLIEQHRKLDRSVSEPTSRYKTELCRPYEESGSCKYGDKCQFAHGYGELRNLARHPKYKTELCRTFHTIGFCPYGPRCHFIHNFEEARIHNQKVSAQLGSTQPNIVGLNPLMSAAAAAAVVSGNGTAANNSATANNVSVNVSLLEQLAASSHVAAAAVATATTTSNLLRANSLSLGSTTATSANNFNQTLLRASSLNLGTNHPAIHHHQMNTVNLVIGATKPKPLNLSPTFSLGSSADSVSPSSSLSQSPTNSMASFFSDDQQTVSCANLQTTPFSFGQDFSLLACSRQSPSPRNNGVCSPLASDEVTPRTPSPLSPNTESRLPVFNRISSTLGDFDNLKI